MQRGQIFLGMVGLSKKPKEGVVEFIQLLRDECSIRFMYFSQHHQKKAKALAAKLGLETVNNSLIFSFSFLGLELLHFLGCT